MKRVVLFTDTHFGCKNNSVTWFRSQEKFINEELIPYIKEVKPDEVIHLGDVFDIRSTVSVMIGDQVREMFKKIAAITRVIVIGGNHDFYSPNSDKYNSIDLILRDIPNLYIYTNTPAMEYVERDNEFLFLPWYEYIKIYEGDFSEDLKNGFREGRFKNVFTHADIWRELPPILNDENINVFSGHIHTPRCEGHLYNLGSCFSLTFADSNQERCFYDVTFDDNGVITQFTPIVNKNSIRFWRFYNDEIFEKFDKIDPKLDDYIELYVTKQNLLKGEFIRRIDDLNHKYRNLWCIPILEAGGLDESVSTDRLISLDMKSMILSYIPDELMPKFQQVISRHEESQSY